MLNESMSLKVLLPHQVYLDSANVQRLVVQTLQGSLGLLPHRLDCTAILKPGILCYQTVDDGERYIAIDAGVLVKTGSQVNLSVRNAVSGHDLSTLRQLVEQQFLQVDAQEQLMRSELLKLEGGFVRRYLEFQRGR